MTDVIPALLDLAKQQAVDVSSNITVALTNVISGSVSAVGGIIAGNGFTITKGGAGIYTINFTVAFATVPVVTLVSHAQNVVGVLNPPPVVGSAGIVFYNPATTPTDTAFGFFAMAIS